MDLVQGITFSRCHVPAYPPEPEGPLGEDGREREAEGHAVEEPAAALGQRAGLRELEAHELRWWGCASSLG